MIDFHTHILPDIDDGSSSVEESVRMIEILLSQGVKKIVLTPHFYAYRSSVERFCQKRASAVRKLTDALEEKDIDVDIYVGCEVLYFDDLWRVDGIEKFCIEGTNYLLLEMPFAPWEQSTVNYVINLMSRGVIPVLAHFDRYIGYKGNMKKIMELLSSGVLLQMNCSYIKGFFTKSRALKFFKNGMVFSVGTDCHNTSGRRPDYDGVEEFLSKKLSKKEFDRFLRAQNDFIESADKIY